jgi:hypothetical protein
MTTVTNFFFKLIIKTSAQSFLVLLVGLVPLYQIISILHYLQSTFSDVAHCFPQSCFF